jgi:hypothetical protein
MLNSAAGEGSEQSDIHPPISLTVVLHEHAAPLSPFIHALALASSFKGELEIVDLRSRRRGAASLGVRRTFEQWRKLPAGSCREDVGRLGVRVRKVRKHHHSRRELARRLDSSSPDLLVMSTNRRKGIGHLFARDLAEHLAHSRRQTTLYIPNDTKPFVDAETGILSLGTILVPVAEAPSPEPAIGFLRRLLDSLPGTSPTVAGVHVGDMFPYISASTLEGVSWEEIREPVSEESTAAVITRTAARRDADLVVMGTNGRDTLSQRIVGSITEQVLRATPCPVLAVAV